MNSEGTGAAFWPAEPETDRRLTQAETEIHLLRGQLRRLLTESGDFHLLVGRVLEALPVGLVLTDPHGVIRSVNRAAEGLLGIGRGQARGRLYPDLFSSRPSPPDRLRAGGRAAATLERAREGAAPAHIDSEVFWIEGGHGELLGAVEMLTDRTETQRLSRELEEQRGLAALGRMAAVAAHEIRNPLGGMTGFLDLLERELGPEDPRRRHTARIREGAEVLERLVAGFMEFSRPVEDPRLRLDLRELAELVALDMRPLADRHRIDLRLGACRRPAVVSGDPHRLRGAAANLVRNAIEASAPGGVVTIRTLAGSRPAIAVEDEGPGVPPEIRARMFEPFISGKARGTGLGLALAARTAESHGGTLRFQDRRPRGARFVLALPALEQEDR